MLCYGVEAVPCFVALDARGRALAKTGAPRSAARVRGGLAAIARLVERRRG